MTRFVCGAAALALFAACGGGGGGGGDDGGATVVSPPTTAATIAQSGAEAVAAVQALNNNARALLGKRGVLEGGSLLAPLGASGAPVNLRNMLARASREQALARETLSCAELGFASCSGSVTVDTNVEGDPQVVPEGSYLALTFNNLIASGGGSSLSMSGGFRMDFLTALNLNATSLANVRFQLTLSGFGGAVDGVSFGPESAVALYEFDAQGVPTLTIDGLRVRGIDNLTATDNDNYRLSNVDLRAAHWGAAATYVDVDYSNWTVSSGRPALGSAATISAGSNSVAVTVQTSSQATVVYAVRVTVNGLVADYLVTASYVNGVPSYTVTAVPT